MTRAEREEMKALSLELFGVSSKWKTIMERGLPRVLSRTVTETVPGENGEPDTTREVEMPILTASGAKQSITHRPTEVEVRNMLLDLKRQRDEMMEARRKMQEEAKAQQEQQALLNQIQKAGGGSAL